MRNVPPFRGKAMKNSYKERWGEGERGRKRRRRRDCTKEDESRRRTRICPRGTPESFADVTVDHCDYVVDTVRRVRKFLNPFHALHATLFFRAVAKPFIMRPAGHGFPMLIQIASFLPLPFVVHS